MLTFIDGSPLKVGPLSGGSAVLLFFLETSLFWKHVVQSTHKYEVRRDQKR